MRRRAFCKAALLNGVGLLALLCVNRLPAQETEIAPNTQLMKTDLLVVTAHPDDETMMSATMARYADEGKVVSLVACTHGEGGGNGTGKESAISLGIVREAELRRCLSVLGTRYLYFLNQPDWAYTESVQATLARWGHDETLRRLVRLVRILRPEVICTMDPAPVGGQHGHHQAAGRLATEVFEAAADPEGHEAEQKNGNHRGRPEKTKTLACFLLRLFLASLRLCVRLSPLFFFVSFVILGKL